MARVAKNAMRHPESQRRKNASLGEAKRGTTLFFLGAKISSFLFPNFQKLLD
jgi:hypothetical protein